MLTPEQTAELKSQLVDQIKHLPDNQRIQAQIQIDQMSPEALELMLNQQISKPTNKKLNQSIFRMIVDGSISAKKIDENKDSIAVLDIKPISKGHVIIIPKKPVSAKSHLPSNVFTFAKRLAKRIISKLKAKGVEMQTETKFGEQVMNIIPYYDQPLTVASARYDAKEKELTEMEELLTKKPGTKIIRKKTVVKSEPGFVLKRRIP